MSDDRMNEKHDANSVRYGLDGTQKIQGRFNLETETGKRIADASDEAKRMIYDQINLEDRQMEGEHKSQARSHEFRILKERDKLTRNFFASNEPVPSDPAAKQMIYDTICEQADRHVQEREQYYMDQIPRQTEKNVEEILKMDREGVLEHGPRQNHNHEQKG